MTDDIVTRLRDMAHIVDIAQGKAELVMTSGDLFNEAANEIERLRADLVNVRDLNEHLTTQLQTFYNEDEAVRGGS